VRVSGFRVQVYGAGFRVQGLPPLHGRGSLVSFFFITLEPRVE